MVDGQGPAPAAPPAAPEPAPAPAPQGQTYDPDTHVLVPKEQLADYDGRFGNVMRESHEYRQAKEAGVFDPGVSQFTELAKQNDMSAQQLYDYITSDGNTPPPAPPAAPGYGSPPPASPAPTQPTDPNSEPLTVGKYNQVRAAERTEEAQHAEVQRTQQLQEQEYDEVAKTLRAFKFDIADDGHPQGSIAELAQGVYNKAITQVLKDEIPEWVGPDERNARLRGLADTPSTSAQRQRATALFQTWWGDLQADAVARFAQGQESVPGGSLEAGAGGPVAKRPQDRSYEEDVEALAASMAQKGRPLD